MKTSACIFILFLILTISCTKEKDIASEILPFKWVKLDNKLVYDYYSPQDTVVNALNLTVIINPGNNNLRFKFDYPQWNPIAGSKWVGDDYNVFRRTEGITTRKYIDCGMAGFGSSFEFTRAPAQTQPGVFYTDYLCRDKPYTAYKVMTIDETVSVPAGTFKTYVLQDTLTLRKEYWDEENGIIKFVLHSETGEVSGEYRLASRNFN